MALGKADKDVFWHDWYRSRLNSGLWCEPLETWMFDAFPKEVVINSRRWKRTPWISYGSGYAVCQDAKEAIEALEPEKHQFIPVKLLYGKDSLFETHQYYTIQINRMINDVDVEKSDLEWTETHGDDPVRYWKKKRDAPVVLPASSIEGVHIWRNERIVSWMMSGELHDALERDGLVSGLRFQEQFVI
jgi:hypothetical protein